MKNESTNYEIAKAIASFYGPTEIEMLRLSIRTARAALNVPAECQYCDLSVGHTCAVYVDGVLSDCGRLAISVDWQNRAAGLLADILNETVDTPMYPDGPCMCASTRGRIREMIATSKATQ